MEKIDWLPFYGRIALVTGGASGIGRSSALAFAKNGASVAIVDVNDDGGMKTAHLIEKTGMKSIYIHCDLSVEEQIEQMNKKVINHFGRIDHSFNNAGIEGESLPVHEYESKKWKKLFDVNLFGVFHCMKAQISIMRKQGHGSIVNCSSVAGKVGFNNASSYVSSKHALIGLSRCAALENANIPIRVNAICPGVIETPMVNRLISSGKFSHSDMIQQIPMRRFGTPEEISSAVIWLSSDESSYITGQTFVVDGGMLTD